MSADGSTAIVGGYADNSNAGAAWVYADPTVVGVIGSGPSLDFAAARLSPNRAMEAVRVLFAMPQAAHARVSVVDVAGRQVR